jgi:hypothetical protein
MSADARFSLILSALSIVFIPMMIMLYRGIVKWTRVESKLEELGSDIKQLVVDKDKTHAEIIRQMTNDRQATDRRLRWLEENVWKSKQ